jgi:hypothetical protein
MSDNVISGFKMVGKFVLIYLFMVSVLLTTQLFFFVGGFSIIMGLIPLTLGLSIPFMIGYKQIKKGGSCENKTCSCD